jgi:hypothetical protein
MQDVKVRSRADAASDHHIITAKRKLKLNYFKNVSDRPPHKFAKA